MKLSEANCLLSEDRTHSTDPNLLLSGVVHKLHYCPSSLTGISWHEPQIWVDAAALLTGLCAGELLDSTPSEWDSFFTGIHKCSPQVAAALAWNLSVVSLSRSARIVWLSSTAMYCRLTGLALHISFQGQQVNLYGTCLSWTAARFQRELPNRNW